MLVSFCKILLSGKITKKREKEREQSFLTSFRLDLNERYTWKETFNCDVSRVWTGGIRYTNTSQMKPYKKIAERQSQVVE